MRGISGLAEDFLISKLVSQLSRIYKIEWVINAFYYYYYYLLTAIVLTPGYMYVHKHELGI